VNGLNNRRWVLAARTPGIVGREHFTWDEVTVPTLTDGQFLVRNLWLSCDPAQRAWMETDTYIPMLPLGEVMLSGALGAVVESRHPGFAEGDLVTGLFGWQDYAVSDGGTPPFGVVKVPPRVAPELALSLFGVTGLTAHIGMIDVARVAEGDTVLVSGAGGAVGSIAAQVAQIKGARAVGIAGGPEKCAWLAELGVHAAIEYKSEDASARIAELCADGIDVYFDNVGGPLLDVALMNLATGARIVCCGAISGYGRFEERPAIHNHHQLILKRATMAGFLIFDHADRFAAATAELATWAAERRIINRVDVVDGLENAPDALRRLFTGQNIGKQLVRLEHAAEVFGRTTR
jgi:NADPH-dependent curcumin reductase CurA